MVIFTHKGIAKKLDICILYVYFHMLFAACENLTMHRVDQAVDRGPLLFNGCAIQAYIYGFLVIAKETHI